MRSATGEVRTSRSFAIPCGISDTRTRVRPCGS